MKKYIIFIWSVFYPRGGMRDQYESCDTIEECRTVFNNEETMEEYKRGQIVDRDTWEILEELGLHE